MSSQSSDRQPLVHPPDAPRRLVRTRPTGSQASTSQPDAPFVQPSVREIHKNAWLKRLSGCEKSKGLVRKGEKFWVVFCVHDDMEAFLEFYPEPKCGVAHRPLQALSLNSCLHVSPSLMGQEEFAVTLPSGVVRLLAHNWEQMIEWVESLQGKLREMNIISPKDNVYSKPPEIGICKPALNSTRDPNSPLPAPPQAPVSLSATTIRGTNVGRSVSLRNKERPATEGNSVGHSSGSSSGVSSMSSDASNFSERPEPVSPILSRRSHTQSNSSQESVTSHVYEHVYLPLGGLPTQTRQSRSQSSISGNRSSSLSRIPDHGLTGPESDQSQRVPLLSSLSEPNESTSSSSQISQLQPLDAMVSVRRGEYRIRREDENTSSMPLREQQVRHLETEIRHPAGVKVILRLKDLLNAVALVDYQGGVWIAGWKQREHPVLYYAFHVGDQLIRMNGLFINCAAEAQSFLRTCTSSQVELILRRLPHGRIFVIKRSRECEPLGLVAEGSTGELSEVLPDGLARSQGLPFKSPSGANWYLTEVNSRPLSLFSKDNEVRERLNAVGNEISILVQPATLVKHLRKGLKQLKSFKDYVVG